MIKLNSNWETFKNNVLTNVSQSGLDLDTSELSFFGKVIEALSVGSSDVISIIDDMASQNTFDLTNNSNLDFIFDFFNIKRLKTTGETWKLDFAYTGSAIFTIKAGAYFFIDEKTYQARYSTEVQNEYRLKTFSIELFEVSTLEYSNFDLFEFAGVKALATGFSFTGEKVSFSEMLSENLTKTDFSVVATTTESDYSFLNRAKNILQFLSADTNYKIKTSILEISNVTDVLIENRDFDTIVTIIPSNLDVLDSTLDYCAEVINYYKTHNFILKKPVLNAITIKNLLNQFESDYEQDLTAFVKSYVRDIYLNDFIFDRNDFEFRVYEYLRKLNSSNFSFDKDKLEIIYSCCSKCDTTAEFSNGKIYPSETKTFGVGVFVCLELT